MVSRAFVNFEVAEEMLKVAEEYKCRTKKLPIWTEIFDRTNQKD
jgi:hypothetical protein